MLDFYLLRRLDEANRKQFEVDEFESAGKELGKGNWHGLPTARRIPDCVSDSLCLRDLLLLCRASDALPLTARSLRQLPFPAIFVLPRSLANNRAPHILISQGSGLSRPAEAR